MIKTERLYGCAELHKGCRVKAYPPLAPLRPNAVCGYRARCRHRFSRSPSRRSIASREKIVFLETKMADPAKPNHPQTAARQVFLAHAVEDKKSVRDLYERLVAHGLRPWLDEVELLPGQAWQTEIKRAINESDVVLACLSRNSVRKNGWVQKEFRLALNAYAAKPFGTIYLIPVKLDEIETPDISIPDLGVSLRDIQWLDLSASGGFERLLEAIKRSGSAAAIRANGAEGENNMAEATLRAALQQIKHKTRGLYPAIARCVESGVDRTEAMIRASTFQSIEADLGVLTKSGLLEFDFLSPEPYDDAHWIRVHVLNRALLRTIVDDLEGEGTYR